MCQYVSFYIIAYSRLLLLIISGLVKTVVLLFTGLTYCVEPGLTKIDASKLCCSGHREINTHRCCYYNSKFTLASTPRSILIVASVRSLTGTVP